MRRMFAGALVVAMAAAVTMISSAAVASFPGPDGLMVFQNNRGKILVEDPNGQGQRTVSFRGGSYDSDPAVSASGAQVALSRHIGNENGTDIWVMNIDGSDPRRVLKIDGASFSHPSFSPDSTQLALQLNSGASPGIYVVNLDGSNLTEIASGAQNPDWSPNDDRIAFNSVGGANSGDLELVDSDGTGLVNLNLVCREPAWSPDASRIACVRQISTSYNDEVATVASDGTDLRVVHDASDSELQVANPSWAPDGTQMLFEDYVRPNSYSDYLPDLAIANIDGSGYHEISDADVGSEVNPYWQACNSSSPCTTAALRKTSISFDLKPTRDQVTARGTIFPSNATGTVTAVLLREIGGRFKKLDSNSRRLFSGRFDASFSFDPSKPSAQCRVTVRYSGDANYDATKAFKQFAC